MQTFATVNTSFQEGLQNIGAIVDKFQGDPWTNVTNIVIQQQEDWIECLLPCICEKANSYLINSTDPTGNYPKETLGFFKEISSYPDRLCCQCWRPWQLTFYSSTSGISLPLATAGSLQQIRPYRIPASFCCPFLRQEVSVERDNQHVGKISQPYLLCGRTKCCFPIYQEMNIYDEQNNLIYFISGQCCQSGVIARSCCCIRNFGPCQNIQYTIFDQQKNIVGEIVNTYNGCFREICSKADRYVIHFPESSKYSDKLLIVYAALLIDYDQFESTCNNLP